MARLIDVTVAKINADKHMFLTDEQTAEIRRFLDEQPTVDAVEVVRCKDCKKGHPELACFSNGDMIWCAKTGEDMKPDDYCSRGERRANG